MSTNIAISSAPAPGSSRATMLADFAAKSRIFVSMPFVSGITPRLLRENGSWDNLAPEATGRLTGTFETDEIGIPALDRGLLYGDAVFEGILLHRDQAFQFREHLQRLYASAKALSINIPYTPTELALRILTALGEHPAQGANYLRLVVTRGFGDLGINPKTAFGCNIYGIISNITLYPELLYERGLDLAVCRGTRRTTATFLDPEIKSCNYLNNIVALLETNNQNCQETLMLTPEGFIAEATCDNIFLVCREPGWDSDPSRVLVCTPHQGCLKGITRNLVIKYATRHKYRIDCSAQIMPDQLFGDAKEVFLTGTAAGIIPVVSIDNHKVGDGKPGPITQMFRALLQSDIANPVMGVKTTSSAAQIEQYWALRTNAEESDSLFINQMFEAIDSREWDKLPMFFSTDIVYERPGYSPLIGYARVAHFYMHERVIASGNHLIEGIVSNDNNAACWGRFVGKNKNGSEIDERFSDVYTFHNGKIVKRRSFFYRPAI